MRCCSRSRAARFTALRRAVDHGEFALYFQPQASLHTGAVELELTETAITDDPQEVFRHVRSLKEIGVRIALDDFGTGYSSLAWLKEQNFDRLKIDYSFVRNVIDQPYDAAIARTVIAMGRSLRMDVLAEGVETLEQAVYLKRFGCGSVQGYLFSQPLPADELGELLRHRRQLELPDLDEARSARTVLLVGRGKPHSCPQAPVEARRPRRADRADRRRGLRHPRAPARGRGGGRRTPARHGRHRLSAPLRDMYPRVVRILLTGYTQIDTVMDAVNQGALFRFAVKPWDDRQLLGHIRDAFRPHHEMLE